MTTESPASDNPDDPVALSAKGEASGECSSEGGTILIPSKLLRGKIKQRDQAFDLVRQCDGRTECWLLLGAGCSLPEVPLASKFVEQIKDEYASYYREAREPKGYAQCMHVLPPEFRRKIIREKIEKARIVEGYIAIAALMQAGFVHKVLTVNFDPLLQRACALVGCVPAVYDLAASLYATNDTTKIKPPTLATPAIVHLHGQSEGIVLINDPEEAEAMSSRLGWLFNGAEKRVWIVAGYSGEQDPVFECLAETAGFDAGLFWLRHNGRMPCPDVVDMINQKDGAGVILNQDSDSFFASLARKMRCYPPQVLAEPLEHVKQCFDDQLSESCQKRFPETIRYIEKMRDLGANAKDGRDLMVQSLAIAGDFEKAFESFMLVEEPKDKARLLAIVAGAAYTCAQLTQVLEHARKLGVVKQVTDALTHRASRLIRTEPDESLEFLSVLGSYESLTNHYEFVLPGAEITDRGLEHLGTWTSTRALWLSSTLISDLGLAHLRGLTNLERLSLDGTRITNEGLAHLRGMTSLQQLNLDSTQITGEGLVHLKGLVNLRELYLANTQTTGAGLAHLKHLASLQWLVLCNTQITSASLADLKELASLQRIDLAGTCVGNEGLAHLGKLASLQSLNLSGTQITDDGLMHLCELTNLQSIYLDNTRITGSGLVHLNKLASLRQLSIACATITERNLGHLKDFASLRNLSLSCLKITELGLGHLKALTNLRSLYLIGTKITGEDLDGLVKVLPKCMVIRY